MLEDYCDQQERELGLKPITETEITEYLGEEFVPGKRGALLPRNKELDRLVRKVVGKSEGKEKG